MRYFIALLMVITANPVMAQSTDAYNWQRARDNYVALVDGRKQFHHLTIFEQRELQEFRRQLREETFDARSPRERCEDDQIARLGSKQMTYLDRRHIDIVCRGDSK